jgi:hypothetical protein
MPGTRITCRYTDSIVSMTTVECYSRKLATLKPYRLTLNANRGLAPQYQVTFYTERCAIAANPNSVISFSRMDDLIFRDSQTQTKRHISIMNCPSRTDDVDGRQGWNQNPNLLTGTTREDFNGRTNARLLRRMDPNGLGIEGAMHQMLDVDPSSNDSKTHAPGGTETTARESLVDSTHPQNYPARYPTRIFQSIKKVAVTYCKFIGPGFMVRRACPCNVMVTAAYPSRYR